MFDGSQIQLTFATQSKVVLAFIKIQWFTAVVNTVLYKYIFLNFQQTLIK